MSRFRDLPAAIFGRFGEKLVARALRDVNVGVIASFKFSGENDNEAPALEFHDKRIVIPDFDAVKDRRRFWLELKTYKEPQWNRSHRCLVHGISARHYDEYVSIERNSGTPAYLGVLEVVSGSLIVGNAPMSESTKYPCLCGCENNSAACELRAKWGSSYPQWYFRRDQFTEWLKLGKDEHTRLQSEHEKISHVLRRHGSKRETAKPGVFSVRVDPWTWTCLPCDVVGTGDPSAHKCKNPQEWRSGFWVQRLRWAFPTSTIEQLRELVTRPIERAQLTKWLGSSWLPAGDLR